MKMFTDLLTAQFALGLVLGFVLERCVRVSRAWILDWRRPLPGGRKRPRRVGIHPRYLAGAIAIAMIGWSLYQSDRNTDANIQLAQDAKDFAAQVQDCQRQFQTALKSRGDITVDNDKQSERQRSLLIEQDDAEAAWLLALIAPPPDIAALELDDRRRAAFNIDQTRKYLDIRSRIRAQLRDSQDESRRLTASRPAYPEPTCGK